jgi:diacylglycerol kinase (ATP)
MAMDLDSYSINNTSMRTLVIVNQRSGGGRAGRGLEHVRALLERRLGSVELLSTERPGHAIELARAATRGGRSLIVAVGGDGTMHEVANGILGKLSFRGTDGSPAVRWFINIVSAGMGGLVDRYVAGAPASLGGRAAYFLASARALANCERGRLRCGVGLGDERHERRVASYMLAICNGRYFGGGMHVAPMARPDDGRFEVVSMDATSKLAFAAFSRHIYDGSHMSNAGVEHFACDRLTVDLENERAREVFLLDIDGEPLGGLPLDVELVPQALTVRVPALAPR